MRVKQNSTIQHIIMTVFIAVIILVTCLINLIPSTPDVEQDEYYYFNNITLEITVDENGIYNVKEKLTATFTDEPSHGIVRTIPSVAEVYLPHNGKSVAHKYGIDITIKNSPDIFNVEKDNDNFIVYLGDEDVILKNITKTFEFSYLYDIRNDRNTSGDLFYWNFIGNTFDTYINNLNFSVTFHDAIDQNEIFFYKGSYGSSKTITSGLVYNVSDNIITGSYSKKINAGEAFTCKVNLPEGFFSYENFAISPAWSALVLGVMLLVSVWIYLKTGSRKDIIMPVEFYPPDGLDPVKLKQLFSPDLLPEDVCSYYIYWANMGYLTIKIDKKEKITLIKIKDISKSATDYETELFNATFSNGNEILLDDVGDIVGEQAANVYLRVKATTPKGYEKNTFFKTALISILMFVPYLFTYFVYRHNANLHLSGYMVIILISYIVACFYTSSLLFGMYKKVGLKHQKLKTLNFFLAWTAFILVSVFLIDFTIDPYCFILIIALFMFVYSLIFLSLPSFTDQRAKLYGRIAGFKNFLEQTETDRLKVLVKDNPSYFYNILPYAYVFNISDEFIKKFESISIKIPEWLMTATPNPIGSFYGYLLYRNMLSTALSIKTSPSYIAKANPRGNASGGGGFGGGFAGGGFGGGGSGRW